MPPEDKDAALIPRRINGYSGRRRPTSAAEMSATLFFLGDKLSVRDGDTIHLYYRAADSCMAVATGSVSSLLAWLDSHSGLERTTGQ
jgi:hypothetical protein